MEDDCYSAYSLPWSEMSSEYGEFTTNDYVELRTLSHAGEEGGEPECRRVRLTTDNYAIHERVPKIEDDCYGAYSVPCGSEMSSEYGDVTANDDVDLRTLSLAGEEGGEPESRCVSLSTDNNAIHERTDFKDIIHMLFRLNDCIWCTNLFEKERNKGGSVITKGIRSRERKYLYTSEDADRELRYIDYVLDKMLTKIRHVMENGDYGNDSILLNDTLEGSFCGCHLQLSSGETGICEPSETLEVAMINDINSEVDAYQKHLEINQKIKLANRFLGIISGKGALDEDIKSVEEALSRKKNVLPRNVQLTTGPDNYLRCCKSGNPLKVTNIDSLLFEEEKWRITVIERNGGDPMEHLEGIAMPISYDSIDNTINDTMFLLTMSLQTTDISEKINKTMFQKVFPFFMLWLSIILFFSDMVSDLVVVLVHYFKGKLDYAGLTLLFVTAPFIADTLSDIIMMARSVKYSLNSMKNYQVFAPCYADLNSYRRQKGKKEYRTNAAEDESEKADCSQIYTVFSSMLAWNERYTLQTKLIYCLNESAPQFLLQLTIVISQFFAGHQIGFLSWFSIVTSLLSLSWSMHMSHFDLHYQYREEGVNVLNNSFEWKGRTMEFVGNCFVYGSRLLSISLVTSVFGGWAILGYMLYLIVIYIIMIKCSGRKGFYGQLYRFRTSVFWPLHRLFTLPHKIGIWRMDSIDHLLYYIETICLALLLPFLLPTDYDKSTAWIAVGVVLSFEALGIALLYIFKRFFHPHGNACDIDI